MTGWMHDWMAGCMVGWMHNRMDSWLDGCMAGCMGGWTLGWMHTCMDGWMDGWMGGWMDGWMDGNEMIRMRTKIGEISKTVHVIRRDECVGKRMMALQVDGGRGRGKPKWRWMDNIKGDPRQNGLTRENEEEEDWGIRLVTLTSGL